MKEFKVGDKFEACDTIFVVVTETPMLVVDIKAGHIKRLDEFTDITKVEGDFRFIPNATGGNRQWAIKQLESDRRKVVCDAEEKTYFCLIFGELHMRNKYCNWFKWDVGLSEGKYKSVDTTKDYELVGIPSVPETEGTYAWAVHQLMNMPKRKALLVNGLRYRYYKRQMQYCSPPSYSWVIAKDYAKFLTDPSKEMINSRDYRIIALPKYMVDITQAFKLMGKNFKQTCLNPNNQTVRLIDKLPYSNGYVYYVDLDDVEGLWEVLPPED